MIPRSGLTYIIVNKKTRLVLDDPVGEEGFVAVNRLNEEDTQKWMLSRTRDGLWTLQNVINGRYLCVENLDSKNGTLVTARRGNTQACRWSIIPEDRMSFRICPSNSTRAASLDTSIEAATMPVVVKDSPDDSTQAWTFMRTVEIF